MARILAIEDEENLRFAIERSLSRAGHDVAQSESVPAALALIEQTSFDAVLTDVNLGDRSGIELVRRLRDDGFDGPIVVMTAYGSVENAVEAMKSGADDYLLKPLSLDELALQLGRLLDASSLRRRVRLYKRLDRGPEVLGDSPAWLGAMSLASRIAQSPANGAALNATLITGETGSGKGVIARWIHDHAAERDGPFVHVNCSALPPTLVESELFGHERGAFTDAKDAREGYFEMASGGTIFLDEIGDMPLELQAKLLVAVEERVFRRIGGTRSHRVEARVIAATNQDLDALAERGKFRRDLLYRLNAVTLPVPPLRDRGGDAIQIAERTLVRLAREHGRDDLTLGDDARRVIAAHAWPGNVRELINALQRVALLSDGGEISARDLFPSRTPAGAPAGSGGPLRFDFKNGLHTAADIERELIVQALRHEGGNVSRAARLIGMQRSSLRYRIERYNLHDLIEELIDA